MIRIRNIRLYSSFTATSTSSVDRSMPVPSPRRLDQDERWRHGRDRQSYRSAFPFFAKVIRFRSSMSSSPLLNRAPERGECGHCLKTCTAPRTVRLTREPARGTSMLGTVTTRGVLGSTLGSLPDPKIAKLTEHVAPPYSTPVTRAWQAVSAASSSLDPSPAKSRICSGAYQDRCLAASGAGHRLDPPKAAIGKPIAQSRGQDHRLAEKDGCLRVDRSLVEFGRRSRLDVRRPSRRTAT